jgi:AraC-like DNA-binding protein
MDWIKRLNQVGGRLALAGSVEVLNWAYNPHLSDNVPHRHTYFEVCQVGAHGRGEFRVQDTIHAIAPGDIFFARPGFVHQIVNTARQKMELSWLCFGWMPDNNDNNNDESAVLMRAFADSSIVVAPDENGRVGAIWRALRASSEANVAAGQDAQLCALATALVLALAQSGSPAPPIGTFTANRVLEESDNHRLARLATRYIHDNLNRRLPVAEIARHVHVSPRHLTRLMQQFTGVAPATYIERARMDRAHGLLLHSSTRLKEIAHETGFADVHHFTRVCTRVWGKSPGLLRAEGENPEEQKQRDVANRQKIGALV